MSPAVLVVLLASGIEFAPAPEGQPTGCVVAAPHEGYDLNTGDLAHRISEKLGWGWVVATGYRSYRRHSWCDVNRPTSRAWGKGGFGKPRVTRHATQTYEEYQAKLRQAAQVGPDQPLALLVEIHGNNRKVEREGQEQPTGVIELATSGFSPRELKRLQLRYNRLVRRHVPKSARAPLAVDALQPEYEVDGATVPFKYKATGAREQGALRPECARRALHFELPACVRADAETRAAYAEVLAELLEPLAED